MRPLETSLFRLHPSSIFGWSWGWKWDQSDLRTHETTFSRPQSSRILGWSRSRKWVQRAMRALETSHFVLVTWKKMSSQYQTTTGNIDFSSSPKSNFGLVKRQKMTFKCHSADWIVPLSTKRIRTFGWTRIRKWLQSDIRPFESSVFRLYPNRIFC